MANDGTVKIGTDIDDKGFKSGLSKLGGVAKTAVNGTVKAISGVTAAATGAVAGLLSLESATEEYRIAQGKLNTAFEAAGYGPETASKAYSDFYKILGDTDTATEASQLLAKLAENEEDVSTWTNIAAGVFGTFGDSLPIEGLIESANETAKVGQVTGVLADALNWAGISEDEFNEKLAACTSESERNQLIMDTLSGTYDEASEAFYRNNEALIQARENQILLDDTLAQLGETVSRVKNNLLAEFLPSIASVVTAFNDLVNGVDGADEALSSAIGNMVTALVEKLPEFLSFGVDVLQAILQGIIDNLPILLDGMVQIVQEIGASLLELAPSLVDAGLQLLTYIAEGIEQGIPELSERIPEIITGFLEYMQEVFPEFLDVGIEILKNIAEGVQDGLPDLVEQIPNIITSFLNILSENFPQIANAGVNIIYKLADGIIQSIPSLLENLPQIISSIVDFIVDNLPSIVSVGMDLIFALVSGLIQAIPSIVLAIPDIIEAIIDGLSQLPGMLFDIGVNIIQGLIDGFLSMVGNVVDAIGSVIDAIFGTAEKEAEVHSPSKRGERLGKNIDQGLANGLEGNISAVKNAVSNLDVLSELEKSMPNFERRITLINDGMVPASVSASVPRSQSEQTESGSSRAGGGEQRVKLDIGFYPREAAKFLRPYMRGEDKRTGEDLVE